MDAKVGPKGQIVIPKPLRDKYGIRPGDKVIVQDHDGHIAVEAQPTAERWKEFWDSLPSMPGTSSWTLEDLKRIRDEQYEEEYREFHDVP